MVTNQVRYEHPTTEARPAVAFVFQGGGNLSAP